MINEGAQGKVIGRFAVMLLGTVLAACGQNPQSAQAPPRVALATQPLFTQEEMPGIASLTEEFTRLAERVVPSVVSITTTRRVALDVPPHAAEMFERYFGRRLPDEHERQALGSGVIISEDGLVITNRHVVADMDEIEVQLSDGRSYPAELIDSDPLTEIAVIKIERNGLQPLPLADSEELRVGEIVFAVGNPFGLEATVTHGLVSGLGREMMPDGFVPMVQTSAAMNPGNSGGPLVNARGEVVGINTAIAAARGGGWQGVGFAVPSNAVRDALESVERHGRILRPQLGVSVRELTPPLARQLGLDREEGALVVHVAPGSPAQGAGVRSGDIIVEAGGEEISSPGDLRRAVSGQSIGAAMNLVVLRHGDRVPLNAEIAAVPAEDFAPEAQEQQPYGGRQRLP